MYQNFEEFLAEVRAHTSFRSNRAFCAALGISHNALSNYEKKGVLPSDQTMVKLAKMGGIDPESALLSLNVWRAPPEVQPTYASILKKLSRTAAAVVLMATASTSADASLLNKAGTYEHKHKQEYTLSHYYGPFVMGIKWSWKSSCLHPPVIDC